MREGWWYSGDSINYKTEVIELDTKDQSIDMLDCDGDIIKLFLNSFTSIVGSMEVGRNWKAGKINPKIKLRK